MATEGVPGVAADTVTEPVAVVDATSDTIAVPSTTPATPASDAVVSPEAQKLIEIVAAAEKAHSLRQHSQAAELFGSACELQAKVNGSENDVRNARLLYQYGKSLFLDAVSKSDVLGGAAVKKDEAEKKGKKKSKGDKIAEGAVGDAALKQEAKVPGAKSGLFSFQGDENWDDSEDEEEGEGEDEGEGETSAEQKGEEGEDDDDFATAWEILDLARVLFHKTLDPNYTNETDKPLDAIAEESEAEPVTGEKATEIKNLLADTYDLLGEISLESESFPQAVNDLRSSLELKLALLPVESNLISEAHYKLSLALEFESAMEGVSDEDQLKGREEAAVQMEHAIHSCKARITKEEDEIRAADPEAAAESAKGKGKAKEVTSKTLVDAREIVGELEQRLADLRAPPPADELESANPMISGLLKDILGESTQDQKKRLEEAVKGATNITGLVRKKEKKEVVVDGGSAPKRKLDDVEKLDADGRVIDPEEAGSKKAKVEDTLDEEHKSGGTAAVKTDV
ncbi:hypothetical protein DFH27DRAFT_546472 [Peziza echinospora]|nr:hypothetical protein DFH27DRAFT_546472 [Peziza echinospora]